MTRTAAHLQRSPGHPLTKDNLHDAMERALRSMYSRPTYAQPNYDIDNTSEFQFVIGLYSPVDGSFLMETEKESVFIIHNKVCLGTGGHLGDYLSRMYLGPKQPLNEVAGFATYLLHEIKAHDPSCGGKSEIVVLWDTGEVSRRKIRDIALAEDYATSFNEASTAMFYAFADLEKSDEQIDGETEKAYEPLYLSLTSRREMREQEKLVEDLQQRFSDLEKLSNDTGMIGEF